MIGLRALSAICIIIDHFYMSHLFDVGFSISACLSIKLCQFLLGVTSKNTAAFLIDMSPIFPLSINDPDVNMIHPKLFCNLWQLLFAQVSTDFFHDRFQFPRLNEAIGILKNKSCTAQTSSITAQRHSNAGERIFFPLSFQLWRFPSV